MLKLLYASAAFIAIALPTDCFATVMMSCSGVSPTPEVSVMFGNGLEIAGVNIKGRALDIRAGFDFINPGAVIDKSAALIIRQTAAQNNFVEFGLFQKKSLIAKIALRTSKKNEDFVGTMILKGRKYWLACGEIG